MTAPTGATRVAGVIGHPVRHSLSPAIHNAAFAALGLDWTYVAFDVAPGLGGDAVRAVRVLDLAGLSVTMPHKRDAADACDRLTGAAARLGVANTVFRDGGALVGDATDGPGFVASLAAEGVDPSGRRVVVLGAGGAAVAVAAALAGAGADVAVLARRPEAAAAAAAVAGRVGTHDDLGAADVVVNATPVGMAGTEGAGRLPLDRRHLRPGLVVADLVYHPLRTPLLVAAEEVGARAVGGLGMLVHQAALQVERWTGGPAPLPAMARAARGAIGAEGPAPG